MHGDWSAQRHEQRWPPIQPEPFCQARRIDSHRLTEFFQFIDGYGEGHRTDVIMSMHASGTFEVTMSPQPPYDTAEGATLSRVSISKQFQGDLEAVSTVEMLSAMTETKGSASYMAIERVTGELHGRAGSFVPQHSGTMTRGKAELVVSVVPDSGSGELRGIAGKMRIDIVEGQYLYTFDYKLEDVASETSPS